MQQKRCLSAPTCERVSDPDAAVEMVAGMLAALYGPPVPVRMYQTWRGPQSGPTELSWVRQFILEETGGAVSLRTLVNPTYDDVVSLIDRDHVAIGIVGQATLLIVGYNRGQQTIIVHDPLGDFDQPGPLEYTWVEVKERGFHALSEVDGPPVPERTVEGQSEPMPEIDAAPLAIPPPPRRKRQKDG